MLRALLLALSLTLLAAAAAAAGASAASVTLAPSDGGPARSLVLTDLAASRDVHGASYTVRAADGTERTVAVADGISLSALLAAAGLDADAFDYISLGKADGSSAIVMRDDLGGTEEGPPVVWEDAQGTHFLRPTAGDGDANEADLVTLADGAPLALALERGAPLVPRIAVSKLRARPRERIDFSASLVGGGALGPNLDYQWYFDGPRVNGANVSHRFPRPGTYLVLLNVVRGGTSIGAPDTVHIRVVRPREPRRDDARGAGESPDDGGSGGTGGGGGAGEAGGTSGGSPAYAPPVAAPPAAAPAAPPIRRRSPAPRRTPPGELVSGTVLASAGAAAAPLDSGRAASAAARGAAADGPLQLPVGAWIAAGALALLALGWALESRHTIPFWQP